jgi:hypothetical protein
MKDCVKHTICSWLFVVSLLVVLSPVPASASLLDGLVAYYALDGNANDISGNANDGTVSGATLTTDRFGNPNSAYHFDGIDDFIDIGNAVKPAFPLTVGLWLDADTLHRGSVFRNDTVNHASNRYGLELIVDTGGTVESGIYEGFSAPWNRISYTSVDTVFAAGEWHHFAIVFNGATSQEIYWDGVLLDGVYTGTGSGMTYSSGSGAIGYDPQLPFLGSLDNITVHNRALSYVEIQGLMGFSAVPIPTALWLFSSGLLGLIGIARRKKMA